MLLDEGLIQPALVEVVADPDLRADELAEALVGGDDGGPGTVLGNSTGQGGDEIVRLVGLGEQGIHTALPEGVLQVGQSLPQLLWHGSASLLVGRIDLLAPAVHLAVKHGDGVGRFAAGQQFLAGVDKVGAGGDQGLGRGQRLLGLHRVQSADEVEGIDDEQVWPGVLHGREHSWRSGRPIVTRDGRRANPGRQGREVKEGPGPLLSSRALRPYFTIS